MNVASGAQKGSPLDEITAEAHGLIAAGTFGKTVRSLRSHWKLGRQILRLSDNPQRACRAGRAYLGNGTFGLVAHPRHVTTLCRVWVTAGAMEETVRCMGLGERTTLRWLTPLGVALVAELAAAYRRRTAPRLRLVRSAVTLSAPTPPGSSTQAHKFKTPPPPPAHEFQHPTSGSGDPETETITQETFARAREGVSQSSPAGEADAPPDRTAMPPELSDLGVVAAVVRIDEWPDDCHPSDLTDAERAQVRAEGDALDAAVERAVYLPNLERLWRAGCRRAHWVEGAPLTHVKAFTPYDRTLARRLREEYGDAVARTLVIHATSWWTYETSSWVDAGPYWTKNWPALPSFVEVYHRREWWIGHMLDKNQQRAAERRKEAYQRPKTKDERYRPPWSREPDWWRPAHGETVARARSRDDVGEDDRAA